MRGHPLGLQAWASGEGRGVWRRWSDQQGGLDLVIHGKGRAVGLHGSGKMEQAEDLGGARRRRVFGSPNEQGELWPEIESSADRVKGDRVSKLKGL